MGNVEFFPLINTRMLLLAFSYCDSPYFVPYKSHGISLENLVLDQLIIPLLKFFLYSH